jgi:presenilin-like A22 family membrane protease
MASAIREREGADRRARGVIVTHPNRDKPVVQGTRATVVLLLLVTAALILIITAGGWSLLEGALPIQIAFILIYLLMAFYASRWSRGVLPIGSGIAVLLGFFALLAGPGWFARDKTGFAQAGLNSGLLGVVTLLIVPVQILLVLFAMRGFKQGWNVEVERRDPSAGSGTGAGVGAGDYPDAPLLTA